MAPLLIPIRCLIFILVLISTASPYKTYASDENPLDFFSDSPSSNSIEDMTIERNHGDNENDQSALLLSLMPQMKQQQQKPLWKRSAWALNLRSTKALPQRRNYRPQWNPLVAAYKRCGELSTSTDRESCFKDAIQMLFVHKLRK